MERIEYKGLYIDIRQEEDNDNPYDEMDQLTEVVTWMSRYEFSSKGAYLGGDRKARRKVYDDPREILEALKGGELAYAAPLYAYIHGGITVHLGSMGNWPDQEWDCGLAGFVYVTKDAAKAEFPKLFDKRGRAKSLMAVKNACHARAKCEVETLDQWLTGDVWCYSIEDQDGNSLDSCGWMYGYEYCKGEAIAAANSALIRIEKEAAEARGRTWLGGWAREHAAADASA